MARRTTSLVSAFVTANLVGACGAPPSNLTGNTVLYYGYGHRDGSASLRIEADGSATLTQTDYEHPKEEFRVRLAAPELESMRKVFHDHDLCSMRSHRSKGVPDEVKVSVSVRLANLDCTVNLWDGEWRDDPDAKACLAAVERLIPEIRRRAGAP